MPVSIQCPADFPVAIDEVTALWQRTQEVRKHGDDVVSVRCVTEEEIQKLNKTYRVKDAPTNVLTFSYDGEHDVALCIDVAQREADAQNISARDYFALLLTHAFLHVTGMDHERSAEEEITTQQMEQDILSSCGFSKISLQ